MALSDDGYRNGNPDYRGVGEKKIALVIELSDDGSASA